MQKRKICANCRYCRPSAWFYEKPDSKRETAWICVKYYIPIKDLEGTCGLIRLKQGKEKYGGINRC